MKERLIGGRVSGVRWRWHSKPRRLLHRLAVRLGVIAPPVHRISAMQEAMADLADDHNRRLLDLAGRSLRDNFKPGRRIEWSMAEATYSPVWSATEAETTARFGLEFVGVVNPAPTLTTEALRLAYEHLRKGNEALLAPWEEVLARRVNQ